MSNASIIAALGRFLVILIACTLLLGLIGMLIPALAQSLSYIVLLPYFIAFGLMSGHFVRKNHALPTRQQRWQLSIGAVLTFWLYALIAGLVGWFLTSHGSINWSQLQLAQLQSVLLVWLLMLVFVSLWLIGLGYWFLGKPLAAIQK